MLAEGGAFDGEISFTFAGHSGAGTPLVLEAGDVAAAAEAHSSDSDKENVPTPTQASPPHPPSVAILDHTDAGTGGIVRSLPSSSSSSSVGTIVNGGDFPQGEDSAGVSGLLGLSGAAGGGGTPRSVDSSEPIYYSSSESGSEEGGEEATPTRQQFRAELSVTRRREPCRARRQLDFSQDENDRIVPSFWDRED